MYGPRAVSLLSLLVAIAAMTGRATRAGSANSLPRLSLERVARFPPPGSRVAGAFHFTRDGHHLYYLKAEGQEIARVLVREEVATGAREVVARPPVEGGREAPLSHEEILRRERHRIQDKGITQYVLAEDADTVVFAYGGDLWLARPGQAPDRLTTTPGAEVDPNLSPDGRRLAYVRDGDLYVMDLETRAERRLTEGAHDGVTHGLAEYIAQEEMERFSGFWWSRDGRRLAYTEVDETGIPIFPIVHQGQDAWEVDNYRYPFAGGPNAKVRLGVMPSAGGDTEWLRLDSGTDDIYLARVRWDYDGSLLAQVESRDQKSLRLLRFDAATGASRLLIEERAESWINLHDDLRPLKDGRFLWSSEASGFKHLELRAKDGSLLRRLTSGDWQVDKLEGLDETAGVVYFSAAKEGPLERPIYRVGLDGGEVRRLTPEPGFHTAAFSPDGRWFVDVHDSVTSAPKAVLRDGSGLVVRTVDANEDTEVADLGLRPPEFVTLKAADGTLLYGAIYKPRDLDPARRYPALVRVYGGPTSQEVKNSWVLTQDLRAQHLADAGYVVFRLDNRGSPRRGRAFETALYRRLGSVEVEDQIAGARYLAALPYVDGARLGIYGWSYGGYMAALCLLKAPDLFRAAVAGAPVTDWDGYDTHYTERYMGRPQDNREGYRESSVLPLVPGLRGRLLIVHGMIDENVHFRHTARLMNALIAARAAYDLLIFPDERHLPRGEPDRVFLEQRILSHFETALAVR